MKHRTFWTRFFLAAAILTAALIFYFSTQAGPESAELSDGVTLAVAKVVRPNYEALPSVQRLSFLETLSLIVRKCAHFGEFALLAFNLMGWLRLRRWDRPRVAALPWAWLLATLYAATDEWHQSFVEARGPALLDVGIDSVGALTGAVVMLVLLMIVEKTGNRAQDRGPREQGTGNRNGG